MNAANTGLINIHSGYRGSVADWRRFLSRWYNEGVGAGRDVRFMVIKKDVLDDGLHLADTEAEYRSRIEARQATLGIVFPRSYVDFLLAYQPDEVPRIAGDGSLSAKRLLGVGVVGAVCDIHPKFVECVIEGWGEGATPDEQYFVYGSRQDDVSLRPEYLRDALMVGYHGSDSNEIMALHPQVRTLDGEMEAEFYVFAGSFRAPSFAELMRQVYRLEIHKAAVGHSETEMRLTAAGLLPMDAWWEDPA